MLTEMSSFFRFPTEKIHTADTTTEGLALLRMLGAQKMDLTTMKQQRPHLFAEELSFELESEDVSFVFEK